MYGFFQIRIPSFLKRMTCKYCQQTPSFHSFELLGSMPNGYTIYFSSLEKAKEKHITKESLPEYTQHLDTASQTPWVWIIDCRGLKLEHIPKLKVCKLLVEVFQERYKHTLMSVFILYPTWHVTTTLNALKPFLSADAKAKIALCESPIFLMEKGVPVHIVKGCIS